MSAFKSIFKESLQLLPEVTGGAIAITRKGVSASVHALHAIDVGFAWGADEMDMIKLRQDAENAPVQTALKSVLAIATSMSEVDTSKMTQAEHIAHVEKCFELDEITQGLLKKMDDRRDKA